MEARLPPPYANIIMIRKEAELPHPRLHIFSGTFLLPEAIVLDYKTKAFLRLNYSIARENVSSSFPALTTVLSIPVLLQ